MNELNFYIAFNLVFGFVLLLGYLYLSLLQIREVVRPRDWLTGLRVRILIILLLTIITLIPSLVYQGVRLTGDEAGLLRDIVTVTSRISTLCTLVIMVSIFKYRKKDK